MYICVKDVVRFELNYSAFGFLVTVYPWQPVLVPSKKVFVILMCCKPIWYVIIWYHVYSCLSLVILILVVTCTSSTSL